MPKPMASLLGGRRAVVRIGLDEIFEALGLLPHLFIELAVDVRRLTADAKGVKLFPLFFSNLRFRDERLRRGRACAEHAHLSDQRKGQSSVTHVSLFRHHRAPRG